MHNPHNTYSKLQLLLNCNYSVYCIQVIAAGPPQHPGCIATNCTVYCSQLQYLHVVITAITLWRNVWLGSTGGLLSLSLVASGCLLNGFFLSRQVGKIQRYGSSEHVAAHHQCQVLICKCILDDGTIFLSLLHVHVVSVILWYSNYGFGSQTNNIS